jgi:putative ABC transport system ATP-binding protein
MALLDQVAEASGAALITITHDVNVAALARRHMRLDAGVLTPVSAAALSGSTLSGSMPSESAAV